jgi:tRNA (guanine-N7-)-methyltransferase
MPAWETIYEDLGRSLHLDIGCARGRFVLEMAKQYPEMNFLGVEIRRSLVADASEIRDQLGLKNLHYLFANINVSLKTLLESFPQNSLKWVTIQFPDPWFKKRHQKRRVVQSSLVKLFASDLPKEVNIVLQSDVEEVALEMRERFLENPRFQVLHEQQWLETSPFLVATEREIATLAKDEPVYRVWLKTV